MIFFTELGITSSGLTSPMTLGIIYSFPLIMLVVYLKKCE